MDDVNDKHLASWAEACSSEGIQNTPLDPTMTAELLLKKHINLDGSKLCNLGFKYEYEAITEEKIREVMETNSFMNHTCFRVLFSIVFVIDN